MSKTISEHNMFFPRSELGIFMYRTCNSMNNLSSYCRLADAKIRASDKDLPVLEKFESKMYGNNVVRIGYSLKLVSSPNGHS